MGLLSRLRAWIGGGTDDETAESPDDGRGDAEDDAADEPTGLDPSAATETRTAATDDAVDALRDVRQSREVGSTDEQPDEDPSDRDDSVPGDAP